MQTRNTLNSAELTQHSTDNTLHAGMTSVRGYGETSKESKDREEDGRKLSHDEMDGHDTYEQTQQRA